MGARLGFPCPLPFRRVLSDSSAQELLLKDLAWTKKPESAMGFEWTSSIRGETV